MHVLEMEDELFPVTATIFWMYQGRELIDSSAAATSAL
jgi:hypothetical protein